MSRKRRAATAVDLSGELDVSYVDAAMHGVNGGTIVNTHRSKCWRHAAD